MTIVKNLTVVLNIAKLSVAGKIKKTTIITGALLAHPTVFGSISTHVTAAINASNALQAAEIAAADGGKNKTTIMRDKEKELNRVLKVLAHEVEKLANGDESIVHLAAMQIKNKSTINKPDFEVYQWNDRGAVGLRVKARKRTIYRWEYKLLSKIEQAWKPGAFTDVSNAVIDDLDPYNTYMFRVVFIDKTGEHPSEPVSFAVN